MFKLFFQYSWFLLTHPKKISILEKSPSNYGEFFIWTVLTASTVTHANKFFFQKFLSSQRHLNGTNPMLLEKVAQAIPPYKFKIGHIVF